MRINNSRRIGSGLVFALLLWASDSFSGVTPQGVTPQGVTPQGVTPQGVTPQGVTPQGVTPQGVTPQGVTPQGVTPQGVTPQGVTPQGVNLQGMNLQGVTPQGVTPQGVNPLGVNPQGLAMLGIDRVRTDASGIIFKGLSYVGKTQAGTDLQVPQTSGTPIGIDYTTPASPAPHLQASPASTLPGSYIKVQGLNGADNELKGTFWNFTLADATGNSGALLLYVADVSKDPSLNSSKVPSNSDVYLYTVYYRQPSTNQWVSLCPTDPTTGMAAAMAIPVNYSDWSATSGSLNNFTFACGATGVASKCARNWGYKPWVTLKNQPVWNGTSSPLKDIPLQPFFDACVISARADYCQDGTSYTKNGTLVDLFDTVDGQTSINATVGVPYAPNSAGLMMHEEYQISALDVLGLPALKPKYAVTSSTDSRLTNMSSDDKAAILALRRSGLESARYADLDPGRSCLASGFIDRCDPDDVYSCYRDANMSVNYGAMIAVNSPRHCDHDELTEGQPLDPMCNECINRVCSVDPTCCGIAGDNLNPASLVWDKHCSDLRQTVCKSGTFDGVWDPGDVAAPAGSKVLYTLRGASGALDGIAMISGVPYLEGWACDPDFQGASSTIQVSVGGPMGKGTRVITARADLNFSNSNVNMRTEIAAECGTGHHVFRVPLLSSDAGATVYVYGFDLSVPAAPFELLRGGQKTVPGPALAAPMAAIWTGWLEPSTKSGQYTFSAPAGAKDSYRVWVNGQYVAANWPVPDPTSSASPFTPPTLAPSLFLQQGVRYAVRVEYLRSGALANGGVDTGSSFALKWIVPDSTSAVDVPAAALHPIDPGKGNGLLGSYFQPADFSLQPVSQTYGAVDYVWTKKNPPGYVDTTKPGVSLGSAFAARFEGQIVPPVTGSYGFTADSDGAVSIWVNGQAVSTAVKTPAGPWDPNVCTHDICRTGSAIDRTCSQGYYCAAQICLADPSCCGTTWDADCLQKVGTVCGIDCRQTKPAQVTLLAGVKYDIKVELQHDKSDYGATLRLYWSLNGSARDTIPSSRLFATPNPVPSASGYGINGAYFSDAFTTPVLDHVDQKASFSLSALPKADRTTSIVCGYSGGPTCSSDAVGGPAITSPLPGQSILAKNVVFQGSGAVSNASVTLRVLDRDTSALVATATATASTTGTFTSNPVSLATGKYKVSAANPTGAASAAVEFDYTVGDPTLPTAPVVTVPTGGIVATGGSVTVGGTATPGAKSVTVTVTSKTVPPTSTTYSNIPVNASTGAWSFTATLPAIGGYTITSTQTLSSGATSGASVPVDARYSIPAVTVLTPKEPTTSTAASVTVTGVAKPGLGKVIVADGDNRYFVERQTIAVDANGNFPPTGTTAVPLTLDGGSHVLKIFQRLTNSDGSTNLDGEPVFVHVTMTPTASAGLKIDCTTLGSSIGNTVLLMKGGGAPVRTGMRYTANVYQGSTLVGTAPVLDDGSFSLTNVRLTGVGPTTLKVTLIASSLSGAGTAESDLSKATVCNTNIKPGPPTITAPGSGSTPPATFTLKGNAVSDSATVSVAIDGVTKFTGLKVASGIWSTPVTVANGSHRIVANQTFGTVSDWSPAIIVSVGDTLPPAINIATPAQLTQTTTDPKGLTFDFVSKAGITATDSGTALTVSCIPASGSTQFPLGTSNVTCSATDTAGNVGSRSFQVVIKSKTAPLVTGSTITAEATGPNGAAVSYQVAATGFVANCGSGSSIVACSRWQPVNTGLGFTPTNVAIDTSDGTLYATQQVDGTNTDEVPTQMVKMNPTTGVWTALTIPGPTLASAKITVDPKTSTVYIPTKAGLYASTDKGATSKLILPGVSMRGSSVDPNDSLHVVAWNDVPVGGSPAALFETKDGGKSWTLASEGLETGNTPGDDALYYPHVEDVAFDRLNPGRMYALMQPNYWQDVDPNWSQLPNRVYRRVGATAWDRLAVPPAYNSPRTRGETAGLGVSWGVPSGQAYPTVMAGSFISVDGGDHWSAPLGFGLGAAFTSVTVDPLVPATVYALTSSPMVSNDYGKTWAVLPFSVGTMGNGTRKILEDPKTKALYVAVGLSNEIAMSFGIGISTAHSTGLIKTTNAGQSWTAVDGPLVGGALMGVQDMAFDPADSQVVYLFARSGVYKTSNGGDGWALRSKGINAGLQGLGGTRNKLAIDPFNRQVLYLSGAIPAFNPPYDLINTVALMTPDGAADPGAGWATKSLGLPAPVDSALLAIDPSRKDVFFASARYGGDQVTGTLGLVFMSSPTATGDYELAIDPSARLHNIDVLPDAARTVVLSYHGDGSTPTDGGIALFSARDAQLEPFAVTPVRLAASGRPSRGPVFDNSDGQNSLFLSGDARGSTADVLYKASLSTLVWNPVGGGQPGIDFRRLVIDRGGGGQLMYTVGADDSLWQSQDGGVNWAEDTTAPSFVNRVWVSPLDGAVYAAIADTQTTEPDIQSAIVGESSVHAQSLWKRTMDSSLPPGARFVLARLHVKCVGTDPNRAVAPGSIFPITPAGSPTVLTCTATDVFGNTGSGTVSINVADTLPPVITVTPPVVQSATVPVKVTIAAKATDAVDGDVALSCTASGISGSFTPAQGATFGAGVTTVTCTAQDKLAHVATVSFPVTVTKTGTTIAAPTLTVPGPTTIDATSATGGTSTFAVSAKSSAGATLNPTCTPALTSTFALGKTTTVSCTVTNSGYTVTRTFDVTCVDRTPPVITVPSPGPSVTAQGPWGATVTFTATKKDIVDGGPVATPCTFASGAVFPIGTTPVVCSAVDKAGNSSTKSFNVVVKDLNAPKVTVPALIEVEPQDNLGARVTYTGVSATDVEDGVRPVDCAPLSGSWFPLGDSRVSCQATDTAGNVGRATFTVRVIDKTPPTVVVPGPMALSATSASGATATFTVSAFDTVSGTLTPTCTQSTNVGLPSQAASGSTFPIGISLVTCSAKDGAGNVGSASFQIVVRDTTIPVLTLPASITASADAGGSAIVPFPTGTVYAKDFGVSVPVVCTPPSGSRFVLGTTPVSCSARDTSGNEASGTFNVIVKDTTAPVMSSVPANITTFATLNTGAKVTYTLPTASDAVDGALPVTCTPASGSTFAPNKTTVSCSATDKGGNKTTKTFTVWVQFSTTQSGGATFLAPLAADGSSVIQRSLGSLPVAFGMTGVSAPITNLTTAKLTIAPVVNGTVGTFVAATPASGTGNSFAYDSVNKRYLFNMALGSLADGTFRLHAELNDGLTREVSFSTVPTWTPLTLNTGWTTTIYNTGTPASALLDGVVYLRGAMSADQTAGITPFVLPAGQRPSSLIALPITLCSSIRGTLEIGTDGTVWVFGNNTSMQCFTSLEGVSFVVDNTAAGNTALTPQSPITNAGSPWRNPTARISSDVVHLAGAIQTNGSTSTAFTLPTSMRPAANVYVPISYGGASNYKGRLFIPPSGAVVVVPDSTAVGGEVTSLEGVTFPLSNTGTGWTCLTPTNGWTAMPYSTRNTCVKDVDGLLRLSGSVTALTTNSNMDALALPANLWPLRDAYVEIDLYGGTMGRVHVTPAGIVTVEAEGYVLSNAQGFSSFEGAAFSLQ